MIWVEERPLQRMWLTAQKHLIKVLLLASWLPASFKGKLKLMCFWRDSAHIFRFQTIIEHVYWIQLHKTGKVAKSILNRQQSLERTVMTLVIISRRSETQAEMYLSSQWHLRQQNHSRLPPLEMRPSRKWVCLSASGWKTAEIFHNNTVGSNSVHWRWMKNWMVHYSVKYEEELMTSELGFRKPLLLLNNVMCNAVLNNILLFCGECILTAILFGI